MLLKSDKKFTFRMLRHPSTSITYRLTLLYMLSAGIILLQATGFLFYAFVKTLEEGNIELLAENIQSIRAVLKEHPDDIPYLSQQLVTGVEPQFIKYYARVLTAAGAVIAQTPDSSFNLPREVFPQPVAPDALPENVERKRMPGGKKYLLMSAWADAGRRGEKRFLIQAALDVSWERNMIYRYRTKVELIFFAGILISALAGIMVARRALRPLGEITRVIQRIRATQLNERVMPSRWPRELAELATSFDEMLNRLEDSFTRLSQFSFDLAHELRTPINNLMGEAEVALAKPRAPEEYQEILASSLEEYRGLLHMIEGLLFLARADSADISIERTELDAQKEIRTVIDYYDAVIEEKQLSVTCSGAGTVNADPVLLRRVITNILSNAIRYTSRGGAIDITITPQENRTICIKIQDTGIGISHEDLAKIFNRFYRGNSAKKQYAKGSGLGLSIVKSIIALHRGTIDIQSTPAAGTTVTLTFQQTV